LISTILAGRVHNRTYRPDRVNGRKFRIFETTYSETDSVLQPTERIVGVVQDGIEDVVAGQQYRVQAGTFHETHVPSDSFAVTAALTRDCGGTAEVMGDIETAHPLRYRRDRLGDHEFSRLLALLKAALND
jgi:hypothetical protein